MSLVILQPAGNQGGREHYIDTIENLVSIDSCEPFVDPRVFRALKDSHQSGLAGMWGVVPGVNNVNVKKWERISVGDLVLFAADKRIHAAGVVSQKFTSERLAKHLWKTNSDGVTWKYMYSLDEIKKIDITYEAFNAIVGYKSNNVIQGFTVMDEERSSAFLDHFNLRSERHIEEVTDAEFEEAITGLDGDLDRKASGWHRKEQARGRKRLLRGRTQGTCQLCSKIMNAEFLIAAHIKRRSECTDAEKRDLDGVMMLACKFGCDFLFEAGYVAVNDNNELLISIKLSDRLALDYLTSISKNGIEVKPAQEKYFRWHFQKRFLR